MVSVLAERVHGAGRPDDAAHGPRPGPDPPPACETALAGLAKRGELDRLPLLEPVAAISCGLVGNEPVLDLDYAEDSTAQADANYVLSASGGIIEVQLTAEERPLRPSDVEALGRLADSGIARLIELQRAVIESF